MTTNRQNYQRCACSSTTKPNKTHLQNLLDCRECCKLNKNTILPESHLHCHEDPDCTINSLRLTRLNQRKKPPITTPPSKKYHYLMVDKSTNVPKRTSKKPTGLHQDTSATTIINVKSHNAEAHRMTKLPKEHLPIAVDLGKEEDDDSRSMGSIDTITTYLLAPQAKNRARMSSKHVVAVKNGRGIVWQENLSLKSTQIEARQSETSTSSDFLFVLREVIKMDNRLREKEPEPGPSAVQKGKFHRWFGWFKLFWRNKKSLQESSLYSGKSKDVSLYDYDDDDF